jgi:hypothetical protein
MFLKPFTDFLKFALPLKTGSRVVTITAVDDKAGLYSLPTTLSLQYAGETLKPALHTLAVGVAKYSKDKSITELKYAAKDAIDFASTIKSIQSDIYRKIEEPIVITDDKATTYNIETAINNLIKRTIEDDVVMLFFSGHGVQENGNGYFLSNDAETDNIRSSALKFTDIIEVIGALVDRNCKIIVFFDACHAGGLRSTKSMPSIQFVCPGSVIYNSSTATQESLESKKYPNGVFTAALIEALKGKAKGEDGHINTLKVDTYVKETVIKETDGKQSPTTDNKQGEFNLF